MYNIDSNEGGDLVLYKDHRLDGTPENVGKSSDKTDRGKSSSPQNIESGEFTLNNTDFY